MYLQNNYGANDRYDLKIRVANNSLNVLYIYIIMQQRHLGCSLQLGLLRRWVRVWEFGIFYFIFLDPIQILGSDEKPVLVDSGRASESFAYNFFL